MPSGSGSGTSGSTHHGSRARPARRRVTTARSRHNSASIGAPSGWTPRRGPDRIVATIARMTVTGTAVPRAGRLFPAAPGGRPAAVGPHGVQVVLARATTAARASTTCRRPARASPCLPSRPPRTALPAACKR
jgi:hypothetical protein